MFKRTLYHFLLAFFLLLGQAGAQAHAISHLAGQHHDEGEPDEPVCAECLAYGHLGAGAPAVPLVWSGPAVFVPVVFAALANPERFPTPAYLSRAPPGFFR